MTGSSVTWEDAVRRAELAQEKMLEHRNVANAEIRLRDLAIVEAYELGADYSTIARRVKIGRSTVHGIIASN